MDASLRALVRQRAGDRCEYCRLHQDDEPYSRPFFAVSKAVTQHKKRPRLSRRPAPLTVRQILAWADEWHGRLGTWPHVDSGRIPGGLGIKWLNVSAALRLGLRGLPGGSSLARLLEEQRGVRNHNHLPRLTVAQILAWAKAHQRRTGAWPKRTSGRIAAAPAETWNAMDEALLKGSRGLPGGSSLPRLLAQHHGVRNIRDLPRLTPRQVVAWADAYHQTTGLWPKKECGPIAEAPGETWQNVEAALRIGLRGLPGGDSLARLLARRRGVRNPCALPALDVATILTWADAHQRQTGHWPTRSAGPVRDAAGETWFAVDSALRHGLRGLAGGSSLARFLAEQRRARNQANLAPLTVAQILAWAEDHHRDTGAWPKQKSGRIASAPDETWDGVGQALYKGLRGLPGGSSLTRLLAQHHGVRNSSALPRLTQRRVLAWADAYHRTTGNWPTSACGPIADASGETWRAVDSALRKGLRGCPGGSSLARLLARTRGVRNASTLPTLDVAAILAWADAHQRRTGRWPTKSAGAIQDAPGETWVGVDRALRSGQRGLAAGSSLASLLTQHRGVLHQHNRPPLTVARILAWADAHHGRTGQWPTPRSGPIPDSSGTTWVAVDMDLRAGLRGLPGGSSLRALLEEHRRRSNRP